jgi:hypothetical protein
MAKEIGSADVVVQIPTITITPNDLREAYIKWETDARLGAYKRTTDDTVERSAEKAAATAWNYLTAA